jgi:non-heme chloroperoxidase
MNDPKLLHFAEYGLVFPNIPSISGFIPSDGIHLHYTKFADGFPVIFLHGGLGNSRNWSNQIEPLVRIGYSPILLDTRGHGKSSRNNTPFSYHLLAADVITAINCLGLDKPIIIGWSDGACTALVLAREHSDLVQGIIYFACNVDPSGVKEFVLTETIEHCFQRHKLDFLALSPTPEKFDQLIHDLEPMQKHEPNYGIHELQQITVPVAILQSEDDEFITMEHAEYLATVLPTSWFVVLPGVSHFAPIQNPDVFNATIVKYLQILQDNRPTIDYM